MGGNQEGPPKVGETYNEVVVGVVGLAPSRHDKGVVEGNDNNLVNALGLEFGDLARETRDVVGLAGGSEGTGDGDNDYLFVLEFCRLLVHQLHSCL